MSESLAKAQEFLAAQKVRKSRGDRGKFAEGSVKKFLDKRKAEDAHFDYERYYDARSAGGRFPSQIADYGFYFTEGKEKSFHGVIEVKEVEHTFRLPKKNFDPDKFPRLARRRQAGGAIIILVCFMPAKLWRIVPFEYFESLRAQPSWDLTDFPTYKSVEDAINSL